MASAEISEWLSGKKDYDQGVELFQKHGKNAFLKKMFSKSCTTFNRTKLIGELQTINNTVRTTRFKISSDQEYDALPEEIKKLKADSDFMFKEMRDLHSQLKHLNTVDRSEASFRILELEYPWKKALDELDEYHNSKTIPKKEPAKVKVKAETPVELWKRLQTLRTYISKGMTQYIPERDEITNKIKNA